jgi:hypothetical protein
MKKTSSIKFNQKPKIKMKNVSSKIAVIKTLALGILIVSFSALSSCKKNNPLDLKGVEAFVAFNVWVSNTKFTTFTSEDGKYVIKLNSVKSEFSQNTRGDFSLLVNNQTIASGRWSPSRDGLYFGRQNLATPNLSYYAIVKVEILSNNSFKALEVEENNERFPGAPEFPFFNNVTYVLTPQ